MRCRLTSVESGTASPTCPSMTDILEGIGAWSVSRDDAPDVGLAPLVEDRVLNVFTVILIAFLSFVFKL